MRMVTLVFAILVSTGSPGFPAAGAQAADTAVPSWFVPPADILGCKAQRRPDADASGVLQRYVCDDAWADVFIYDPAQSGITTAPGETTVEAEFRMFLDDTAQRLIEQGLYDSLAFDDLRPLCFAVPGGEVQGGLLQGTGVHRGQVRFTVMAIFAVKGLHLKLRVSGSRSWMFDPFRFSEALLRGAIDWRQ